MSNLSNSARPTTVTASFWIWVLTTVIGLIGAILAFALAGSAPQFQQLEANERAAAVGIVITAAIITLILVLVRLLFAYFMLQGRNWARIVLAVLGALGVILTLTGAATAGILEWVNLVLTVVAIVLMFLPASNAYFRSSARR